MNLYKTLKAYNEAPVEKEQQLILDEALSILGTADKKDISILSALGMDKNLKEFDKISAENKQADKFDEIYDISVIRKMAINYGLRFLPASLYKGTIDPILPSMLNAFIEKHNIKITATQKRIRTASWYDEQFEDNGFYILAPSESFELQQRPKDPIIFYKVNENKYAFIHKWGNDLSWSRRLLNLPQTSRFAMVTFVSLIIVSAVCGIVYITNVKPLFALLGCLMINIPILIEFDGNAGKWNSKYN